MNKYSKNLGISLIGAALMVAGMNVSARNNNTDAHPAPQLRLMPRSLSDGLFPGFDRSAPAADSHRSRYGYVQRDIAPPNRFRLEPVGEPPRNGLGIEHERAVNNVLQLRF